jgi:hypothetical protein
MLLELKSINSIFDTEKGIVYSNQGTLITSTPIKIAMMFNGWVDNLSDDDVILINENL